MQVRFIFNSKWVAWFGASAITLYPFVFVEMTPETALRTHTIAHELVHVHQVRRMGWLRFYVTYAWHYLATFVKTGSSDEAYFTNPYEVEAYETETEKDLQAEAEEVLNNNFLA